MLVLIGASASGKTEIAKELCNEYNFSKYVTTTTRKKRPGEENHKDYHFVTKKKFKEMKSNKQFYETTLYNNNYYGTPINEAGDYKVLIVDPNGANAIFQSSIQHTLFVLLKTTEQVRIDRMMGRGDTLIHVLDRINKDDDIFNEEYIKHIDYVIDTTKKTVKELSNEINNYYQKSLIKEDNLFTK